MESLKKEILELLDRDIEFRYAVAGYLGLLEILKRLDSLADEQVKLREEQVKLREEQVRLSKEQVRFREEQTKIFKEIGAFREEQTKIWKEIEAFREEQTKIWKEIGMLREEQTKIWKEIDMLREEQIRLREDFNRMLEVIKQLQEGQIRIEKRVDFLEKRFNSLEGAMISGFGELSKFAGLTFEEFVRRFLTASMRKSGDIPEYAELVRGFVDGEEINLFLEEPLIVGEATSYAESTDEMLKLLRKVEVARAKYSREPRKILVILTAKREAAKEIRKIAEEKSVEIIIGKIVD
ncbi:MAG: hypothetical protein QXR06_02270 [Candidatus Bathyarchaeia archaeon]|nr:hypothetical protein [Candidatus Bathyarchaeota archaeon]